MPALVYHNKTKSCFVNAANSYSCYIVCTFSFIEKSMLKDMDIQHTFCSTFRQVTKRKNIQSWEGTKAESNLIPKLKVIWNVNRPSLIRMLIDTGFIRKWFNLLHLFIITIRITSIGLLFVPLAVPLEELLTDVWCAGDEPTGNIFLNVTENFEKFNNGASVSWNPSNQLQQMPTNRSMHS